jgi:hypothetical protein
MTEEVKQEIKAGIKNINKHDFYFETPLYEEVKYSQIEKIDELMSSDVDAYSAKNNTDTTYGINFSWIARTETKYVNGRTEYYAGFALLTLKCKRKNNDILYFFVFNDQIKKKIIKVGQMPSIADLQFSDIERKYKNVLERQYLNEFKKSIVSASHGYGVAAFIYLRRIFENLISQTFQDNINESDISEADFISKRMEDKIDILKKHLPSQLMTMKSIYGILSLGVHQLDEDECLGYFHPLKLSVELILDQKIREDAEEKRDEDVKKQVQQITQKLSSGQRKDVVVGK